MEAELLRSLTSRSYRKELAFKAHPSCGFEREQSPQVERGAACHTPSRLLTNRDLREGGPPLMARGETASAKWRCCSTGGCCRPNSTICWRQGRVPRFPRRR